MRDRIEEDSADSDRLSSALEPEPDPPFEDMNPVELEVPKVSVWLTELVVGCTGIGNGRGNASE